ncbi:hypothetical protein AG1IA_03976 [Rhizoctonia solani AG-1 IA]|uniref:Uncharacterized protein n=1 Tax=Thanatephorus cucumeris (strain AG1-IA) TaxID=983506 RepID=L8WYU9_THACA|nr:hypothetical protein AG1IA_03976 [Rhizoctonia solani AG-1 IA]
MTANKMTHAIGLFEVRERKLKPGICSNAYSHSMSIPEHNNILGRYRSVPG